MRRGVRGVALRWSQAFMCLVVILTTLAVPHGGAAAAQQKTDQVLVTGSVLTWDTSWQNFLVGDREVMVMRMVGQSPLAYDLRLTPSSEMTPEEAVNDVGDDFSLIASGEEPTGGVYTLSGSASGSTMDVVFRHAWTTADGQWTVLAQATGAPGVMEDAFAHITATITLDGVAFWSWMDTTPYVDAALAWGNGGGSASTGGGSAQQGQEGVNQLTFQSGQVVRWEEPWKSPRIDGNREVYLGNDVASGMLISMDPASEVTPQDVMYPASEFDEIMAGPDNSGGTYYMGGMKAIDLSGQETFWVVFRRAWTTADGQWTVVTQLDTLLPNLESDLASVKDAISIDSFVVWKDVDPSTLAAKYYEWAGVTPQPQSSGSQQSSPPQASASSVSLQGGTVVGWSEGWVNNETEPAPIGAKLENSSEGLFFWLYEDHDDTTLQAAWTDATADYRDNVLIAEGTTPTGGSYGLWQVATGETVPDGTAQELINLMIRAELGPGMSYPLVTMTFNYNWVTYSDWSVLEQVTINGESAWGDVDTDVMLAMFENGGPTGAPLFLAQRSASTVAISSQDREWGAVLTTGNEDADLLEGSYTSELFGAVIEWGDAWEPGQKGVNVYPDQGKESIRLLTIGDDPGGITVYLREHDSDEQVRDIVDYWASDDRILEYEPEGTEVVLADSGRRSGAVVLIGPASMNDATPWVTVREVFQLGDGVMVEVSFGVPLATFEDAYDDATRHVSVDGDEVLGYFSTEEIQAALP